jgi:hypothetical protein
MHLRALKEVIASVTRRAAQGDCPTEPVQRVELLEEAVLELVARLDDVTENADCECDASVDLTCAVCKARGLIPAYDFNKVEDVLAYAREHDLDR